MTHGFGRCTAWLVSTCLGARLQAAPSHHYYQGARVAGFQHAGGTQACLPAGWYVCEGLLATSLQSLGLLWLIADVLDAISRICS